jgi:hypothetical protein
MSEYPSMFIEFAASITSKSFNIAIATAIRNGEPHLLLKLELKYSWSNPANQWANGYYDYETSRQVPGKWKGSRSPWDAMSFSGEFASDRAVTTSGQISPKFCSICGNPLIPEAKFCPGCGTSLKVTPNVEASPHSNSLIGNADFSEGGNLTDSASRNLAENVVSAVFADFAPDERTLLLAFLADDFSEATVNSVIDGRISTSSNPINLANMQNLHAAVTLERPLSAAEVQLAELALRESPICFGYWGALKALLKYHPEKVSKEAIGVGFARISDSGSLYTSWWNSEGRFEDIRFLSELNRTPSAKTRYYLSRRGRRDLVRLSTTNVKDYLAMSTGFLLSANRGTSTTDFMLGHIVFGGEKYTNERSRAVRRLLGDGPFDPYRPELWKNATAELNKLWLGISNSRVIQDFTFSLANTNKITLLPLQGRSVNLALQSEIPELRKVVIDQIVDTPDNWGELDEDGWRTFIGEVDEKMVPLILRSIGSLDYTYSLENAIETVLDAIDDPHSFRMQQLALLYFTLKPEFVHWERNFQFEGKAAAALLFSEDTVDIQEFRLLSDRLGFEGMLVCWSFLRRHGDASAEIVNDFHDAAVNYWSNFNSHERQSSFNLLATIAPEWFADLGSSFIARDYDFDLVRAFIENCYKLTESKASVTDALISLLLTTPKQDVALVLREALSNQELAGAISLGDILNQSGQARSLAWLELSDVEDSVLGAALRSNKQMLTATMLELQRADIANARGIQVSLLMNFFSTPKTQDQIPSSLLIGAASNPFEELANLGNKLLKKRGLLGQHWLALAESQMPLAIGFAREYLRTLPQVELSSAVLLGADSPVAVVRDMALDLLDAMRDKIDVAFVYSRLAESRDPVIRGRVAEEALLAPWSDGHDLVAFDAELLVTLRRTRSAREDIKARIDALVTHSYESRFISDERINALISLTRIGNSRDREWALTRLAQLKIAGVDLDGVTLIFTNGGGQNV